MNSKLFKTALFLPEFLLAGTVCLYGQGAKKKGLKKGPNIALNITTHKTFPEKTYLNLGLFSNYQQLNGTGVNIFSSITHFQSQGMQIAGLANVTGINTKGIQISGLANVAGKNMYGLNLGGLMNISGSQMKGVSISGLGNFAGQNSSGLNLVGGINISGGKSSGLHFSGLANIAAKDKKGCYIAGLMNVTGMSLKGVQLSALGNIAAQKNQGLQLAALGNVAVANKGTQISLANYSVENNGLQCGLLNVDSIGKKGVQIGLVNISRDSMAHQFGLVNLCPSTRVQLIATGGNLNYATLAVRFKQKHTYTEAGVGAFNPGSDFTTSLSVLYRTGLTYPLSKKVHLGTDLGYFHVENMNQPGLSQRMYSFQPRINLEYSLSKRIGIIIAGGYQWTKPYGHHSNQSNNATFDIGLVFF